MTVLFDKVNTLLLLELKVKPDELPDKLAGHGLEGETGEHDMYDLCLANDLVVGLWIEDGDSGMIRLCVSDILATSSIQAAIAVTLYLGLL